MTRIELTTLSVIPEEADTPMDHWIASNFPNPASCSTPSNYRRWEGVTVRVRYGNGASRPALEVVETEIVASEMSMEALHGFLVEPTVAGAILDHIAGSLLSYLHRTNIVT